MESLHGLEILKETNRNSIKPASCEVNNNVMQRLDASWLILESAGALSLVRPEIGTIRIDQVIKIEFCLYIA